MSTTVELFYNESDARAAAQGEDNAQQESTPLVILHGLFGSADNWRSHIKSWAETRRVIAVDLRNHGRSPHVAGMSYPEQAGDVIAMLDKLEIACCDLLGHSMGGKVAMQVALDAPERLRSLIVADIAPVVYEHGHDEIFDALDAVRDAHPASRKDADGVMAQYVETPAIRQFLATNLVRLEDGSMGWRVGLDQIAAGYTQIVEAPQGQAPVEMPTLLLRGERSHYVQQDGLAAMRERFPALEETSLDAGHWLHAERAAEFQQAVLIFLDRVSRT
ncbi:alpha/beta fold hydrolase [Cobetia sp. L2A1]|uniref:alpha/beta fold hydrolase n=1 Tax=Cobetia sp. L2A1 TaxID=2686360 RepID=UPI00131CCDA9|nr:alpha/beta fold hydrolase [Cobetia sp. L2A1]